MIYKYAHPEWFQGIEEPDLQAFNGNIIIHGTEGMGALAAHALKKLGIEYICFTDNDTRKQGTEFFGHKILSPEEAFELYPDALVFIASGIEIIEKQLFEIGFSNVFDCWILFKEVDFDGWNYNWSIEQTIRGINRYLPKFLKNKNLLPKNVLVLNVALTTRCNLRCKYCTQLIPYIKNPQDYDSDEIVKIVNKLTDFGFFIPILSFYTGESFLYKDLPKLLNEFVHNDNIEKIYIITNGALVPSQEITEALVACPKAWVRISNYGRISNKLNKLVELFDEKSINYEITNHNFWYKRNDFENQHRSIEELQDQFYNCPHHSNFMVLVNGKLALCAFAGTCEMSGMIEIPEDEVLNFRMNYQSDSEIHDKIIHLLNRQNPHTACQYCAANIYREKIIKVPVAEQLEG